MKNKIIYKYVGKVLIVFAFLLLAPIIITMVYKENPIPFIIPLLLSLLSGIFLNLLKNEKGSIYAKDGFIIVSLSWIFISLLGALPFWINGDASFIDSLFESVSGLTTTGASVFTDVENLNKSILFWRSYSHFIGGMGVLAFVMAIIPLSKNDKSMHVLKAEMAGPSVAKLVPSIKKTLLYLYSIYIGLTLTEFVLLLIGKMSFFESLVISMSTAATGGFSILNSSIATYGTYNQIVIAIFMFLFGVNFNIYFLILMKDAKTALKSEELRVYVSIYILSVLMILLNTYQMFSSMSNAITSSFFHVGAIMTSTGFSIGDINIYPTSCRILFLCLMLVSACAGSTCGGFKISRLIICLKKIKRDLLKVIHPNSVHTITFEGKKVDEETVNSTCTFLFLYAFFIVIIMGIVSFDNVTLSQTINAVFATFGNTSMCFEISNFSIFNDISTIVMTIGMLLGRLEIFPLLVLFSDLKK
ncbi:MAG: TrkH family potassium uptake protein [Bacilli bacterium]|nr:TrkH family potassium uptake protein [Bacilli bacterium]